VMQWWCSSDAGAGVLGVGAGVVGAGVQKCRGPEIQRCRSAEVQIFREREVQMSTRQRCSGGAEVQRYSGAEMQGFIDTEKPMRFGETEVQRNRRAEERAERCRGGADREVLQRYKWRGGAEVVKV